MGKHDKKKKKKDPEKVAKKAEKKELKTEKNAKKKMQKLRKNGDDDDEEDIEKMIAKFKALDAAQVAVTEEPSENPSPRAHSTFIVNPLKENEMILFGGEFYNGDLTFVYNDLFRYNVEKNEWKKYSSPNTPPPRCSHQAAIFKNYMYVFGGEFTSPSQNQFYHYKDLWRLNLDNFVWEQLNLKGGPSARSGHRMIVWKHKLIVVGGFYDTLSEIKYYNDVHMLDLDNNKWQKVEYKFSDSLPRPRSGFVMGLHENTLFMYGGYSKEKKSSSKYAEAEGVTHTDMWAMNLANANPSWEKQKRSGIPPSERSGMAFAVDKRRLIVFGGVADEETETTIKSVFYNDMYLFQMDSKRWFTLKLHQKKEKAPKQKKSKQKQPQPAKQAPTKESKQEEGADEDNADNTEYEIEDYYEDEEGEKSTETKDGQPQLTSSASSETPASPALTPAFAPVQTTTSSADAEKEAKELARAKEREEQSKLFPSARINASMLVVKNNLYIYGGMFEQGEKEIALNDLHVLNLHKLDGFQSLIQPTIAQWLGEESDDDDEDDEEGDSEDEENEEKQAASSDEEGEEEEEKEKVKAEKMEKKPTKGKKGKIEDLKAQLEVFQKDGTPTANTNELLKDFFERTKDFWAKYALDAAAQDQAMSSSSRQREDSKSLRKNGFQYAEERWKEMRQVLSEFELIEEESKQEIAEKEAKKKQKEKDAKDRRK
eukprot:TRINITY_DN3605_c0_g1_i1.p1 TRINITY_DN3605_c0_g1~~TRINITY_DN3605_c0_g1_i1.p1  ORF type:complete len:710 (-),score=276.59 TRINITY_DN3605_c0_g1_i1:42-2171(-)